MRIWRVGCHAPERPDSFSPPLLLHAPSKPSPRMITMSSFIAHIPRWSLSAGNMSPCNPQATAEYVCAPFLAGCIRIRQFASEHHLTDRLHTMLWLTKTYALPASMYACQVWGTIFMKEGAEMDNPLQTVHLCLLKRILG
eukprot:637976-Pelagomonas_calceolata.AAC.1